MRLALALLLLASACEGTGGDVGAAATSGSGAGGGGGTEVDAGLGEWTCQPGELEERGVCQPAGIGPDECGEGFEHDGRDGCEPILPLEPCPEGELAVPGESECRPIGSCGSGTWGDIPVDGNTQHVDGTYPGGDSDGTAAKPWTTVQAAIDAATPGAIVAVAAGVYANAYTSKPIVLWGKCPEEVTLTSPDGVASYYVGAGGDGSEVRDIGLSGYSGLVVYGATEVQAHGLWVHDTSYYGVDVRFMNDLPSELVLSRSLIENAARGGIYLRGAALSLEASVIRDVVPGSSEDGRGIFAPRDGDDGATAELIVQGSLIERVTHGGIIAAGSSVEVVASVIRDVAENPTEPTLTSCITVELSGDAAGALEADMVLMERCGQVGVVSGYATLALDRVVIRDTGSSELGAGIVIARTEEVLPLPNGGTIRRTVVSDVIGAGISFSGGDELSIERTVVRAVAPSDDPLLPGFGIAAERFSDAAPAPLLIVRGSRIEDTYQSGLHVSGGNGDFSGVLVSGVKPPAGAQPLQAYGTGIQGQVSLIATGSSCTMSVKDSLVESVEGFGIGVLGADATIEAVWVRHICEDGGTLCRGIQVQPSFELNVFGSAAVSRSLIEDVAEFGVAVIGARASLDRTVIRDLRASEKGFGDGLAVVRYGDDDPKVDVSACIIERPARAGITNFGATLSIGGSRLECAPIWLNGEPFQDSGFVFDDAGDNDCGCGETREACKALSNDLEPPPLL